MTRINESDVEWVTERLAELAASLDVPLPSGDEHLRSYAPEVGGSHRRGLVLVGVGTLIVLVLVVGVLLVGQTSSTPSRVAGDPGGPGTTTQSTPTASELAQEIDANSEKPWLPPETRKAVYDTQLAWAQCLRSHGFQDVTDPKPSFGDGETPAMHIGNSAFTASPGPDTYPQAEAACSVEHQAMLDAVKVATGGN